MLDRSLNLISGKILDKVTKYSYPDSQPVLTLSSIGDFTDRFSMGGGRTTLPPKNCRYWYRKWHQTIPLHTHCLPLNIFGKKKNCFVGVRPVKGIEILSFVNMSKPKSFFTIFSKMNSTHPLYPIMIPNTPYVKKSVLIISVPIEERVKHLKV